MSQTIAMNHIKNITIKTETTIVTKYRNKQFQRVISKNYFNKLTQEQTTERTNYCNKILQ